MFHQPIEESEKGIDNSVFVTLSQKIQLRFTFQRFRRIICKRLTPFSLKRRASSSRFLPLTFSLRSLIIFLAALTQGCVPRGFPLAHAILFIPSLCSLYFFMRLPSLLTLLLHETTLFSEATLSSADYTSSVEPTFFEAIPTF